MKKKIRQASRIVDEVGERVAESALHLKVDILAAGTELRIEKARERNEQWEGVFAPRQSGHGR